WSRRACHAWVDATTSSEAAGLVPRATESRTERTMGGRLTQEGPCRPVELAGGRLPSWYLQIPQNWPLPDHPVGGAYCRLGTREGWAAGGSALRTWELTLALDPGLKIPLFLQLAQAVQHDIRSGRLRPGARLPGSRTLARELGVHRNTVLAGYGELLSQGW